MFEFLMGGVMQGAGAIMQADEESSGLLQEAEAADRNASIAVAAGKYNVMRQQQEAYKVIGSVKSDYAASGITADSGSVLDVIRESHINAELDRQNIKYGADLKALELRSRATALRQKASNVKQMGYFSAFSSLFGAGAKSAAVQPTPGSGGSTSGFSGTNPGYGSAGGSYTNTGGMA